MKGERVFVPNDRPGNSGRSVGEIMPSASGASVCADEPAADAVELAADVAEGAVADAPGFFDVCTFAVVRNGG